MIQSAAAPFRDSRAQTILAEARELDRCGRLTNAAAGYKRVTEIADPVSEGRILAEALRRLAVIHRRHHEVDEAMRLCEQSRAVAERIGDAALAAEAMNGMALVHLWRGDLDKARAILHEALETAATHDDLRGRIEQNLGITANIRGDFRLALAHYERSLEGFRAARNDNGCALAYHNLGMISADRQSWADADRYYRECLQLANATGDVHLRGLALLNRTEVFLAQQNYQEARQSVEESLRIFDRLETSDARSSAYKFLGVLYRETGSAAIAESRFNEAIGIAREAGTPLHEAEATRELALLYQSQGRMQDALRLLNTSYRLFRRLDARHELIDVTSKVAKLESVYLQAVAEWGRSIESTDSYTFGHSERVSSYGTTLARAIGMDETELTTVRIGAYLHDLGKVKVPHEILTKPGKLTDEEFAEMKRHPEYGVEMLATVEFPWDIKPIIRWHHEKNDGRGYPDRLCGDEIPMSAQVICIVDVYDALTTTRSYRSALTHETAVAEIERSRGWWRNDVYEAFRDSLGKAA